MTGPDLGLASFSLHYRGRIFRDHLNLYRYGNSWQVAAKVTGIQSAAK